MTLQPAAYSAEALRPWFHTIDGRRQWLEPLIASDSVVLVDTGREAPLDWPDQDAVLGLKAFRMGPQQMLALDMSTWNAHPRDLDSIARQMQDALSRLVALLLT